LFTIAWSPKEYFRYCPQPSVPLCPPSGAVVESPATQMVGTFAPVALRAMLWGSAETARMKMEREESDDRSFITTDFSQKHGLKKDKSKD
jgi:hypothetical protein